jgi:hypothetical protein
MIDYAALFSTLLKILFGSIVRLSGEHAYEVMFSLVFALICVSLFLTLHVVLELYRLAISR